MKRFAIAALLLVTPASAHAFTYTISDMDDAWNIFLDWSMVALYYGLKAFQ